MLTISPRKIILTTITFLTMNTNDFLPFKITEGTNTSTPFIAVSDTFPSDNFEVWTKENLEEMKKKNFEKSVDSFKPIW
jgi:hypothetical protein